jgi:endonuclease V-like protein UPF0215 family
LPIVGVEDGSFQKGIIRRALLAAVLLRGLEIEDVKFTKIAVDGLDATERLCELLSGWDFAAVLLAGVSFAGFNIIKPTIIYEKFEKPVIIVTRTKPDNKSVRRALQRHFKDWRIRWEVFEKTGSFHKVIALTDEPPIYVETIGADAKWACNLIQSMSVCCRVPEPIRIARLIARGLS